MGITAFYGSSMEDEDAVKLLQAAYDMGYRYHGITKKQSEVAGNLRDPAVFLACSPHEFENSSPWVPRFRNASFNSCEVCFYCWQLGGLTQVDDVLMS